MHSARFRAGAVTAAILALVTLALSLLGAASAAAMGTAALGAPLFAGAVTTAAVDLNALLKIHFSDSPVNNSVTDSEFWDLVAMDPKVSYDKTTGGRYIETAQMFALPAGHGARREGDAIPVPNGPVIVNSKIYLRKLLGSLAMTGDAMRLVRTDEGAYVDYLERSLPSLVERQTNDVDRMAIGTGSGAKAKVSAIAGTTLTLTDSHGVAGYSQAWVNFLAGEQIVLSATLDGTALRANSAKILNVLPATNQIVVDAVPTLGAVGDFIFEGDSAGTSAAQAGDQREFMGLLGHVDDGSIIATYQTIPRASYDQWKGTVINAGAFAAPLVAGQLDQDALTLADDTCAVEGGGKPNLIMASRHGQRAFWRSIRGGRQTPNNASQKRLTAGKGGLVIELGDREAEVRASRKLMSNICFGLQTDTLTRHELGKLEWDDTTGNIWKQGLAGSSYADTFFAYNHRYVQFSCKAPRKNFVIRGLTQTA